MIRKGILKAFDGDTYKASVQVIGSLSVWLDNVTVSAALNRADMVAGRSVVLLSLDPSNPDDCILVGLWGVPQEPPAPGAHENTHTDGASDEIDSALDPRAYPLLADTLANRPAAGVDGRFFWTTDEHILYRDNGTNWVKAAVADHADLDGVGASDHHAQFENVVEDTTPQLGGNLDAQNYNLNNVGTLNVTHINAAGGGYDFNLQGLYYFHLLHNGSIIFNVTPMDVVGIRSVGWIPLEDDTYDLGQPGAGVLQKRWRDLYLSGNIIGTASPAETLKLDAAAGTLYISIIKEIINNAGVTVEGVLLKDSEVDGVNVSAHYSRHELGGEDELYIEGLSGDPADTLNKSLLTAKGSIVAASAASTPAELAVGTDDYSLVADSGEATGLNWAKRAKITTAAQTIYVDGDASGAEDGTSWTDAFTTIQDAWDSLPDIIAHAVTIKCRAATNPYREQVAIDSKYVIAPVTIEGEYYWYGDCEANATAGDIVDTGAFTDVAVGDRVLILDLNGANGRVQDYELCTVDDVSGAPNSIGTDGSKTATTGWKYVICRTEISGSDNGTDGGTARDNCFVLTSVDNITINGFRFTFSDDWFILVNNCRACSVNGFIAEDVDKGINNFSWADFGPWYGYVKATDGRCINLNFNSATVGKYVVLDANGNMAVTAYAKGYGKLNYYYLTNASQGVYADAMSTVVLNYSHINNNVTTGVYARLNSFVDTWRTTNNATTPGDPAGTSDATYIRG